MDNEGFERLLNRLDRGFERLLNKLDRRKGSCTKAFVGQRYKRQGRFAEALEAFREAEAWYAEDRGPDHADVVRAIVMEAYCCARMRKTEEACFHYDRALAMMSRIGDEDQELADRIKEYVATVCG